MTCPRRAKWFGACRFEARYDEGAPDFTRMPGRIDADAAQITKLCRPKTYIHDICTRCGKVVERTKEGT